MTAAEQTLWPLRPNPLRRFDRLVHRLRLRGREERALTVGFRNVFHARFDLRLNVGMFLDPSDDLFVTLISVSGPLHFPQLSYLFGE
ncbi:hypothetical protein [Rariglobus hedericola]|uniref:Uncharacterized protein n=1 Tax=Rariglobus hedericola TaxID=2597822 RepID=A0A556QPG2_9BACT|nr:hypothetical protein [Rariglobus hedericola]TSJ78538.1 hypothetical protein FPL22_04355 [Rariglobus hedericola]